MMMAASASAAEWQWTVPVQETGGRAYLWIPPSCRQVRGLIVTDANMMERIALENPVVRRAAEKSGLGIILFAPKTFSFFTYKDGADKILLKALADLARESGYAEIEFAPLMPLGNSASTPFAWYAGYWNPQRTIAVISLKGASFPAPDFDKDADASGVPAFAIVGEYYEWPTPDQSRLARWSKDRDVALRLRNEDGRELLTFFADVSRGHFDWTDDLAEILAMYITKAAQQRLPKEAPLDSSVSLRVIDPKSGWLIDSNTVLADHVPPAPYKKYTGDRTKAFWVFDKEMALAIERYGADQKTKTFQMVTFIQDGNPLEGAEKGFAQIRFEPMEEDEMAFKLEGTYLEKTPASLSNQPPFSGHSSAPISFACMGGAAVQTGPDTFRIRFSHFFPGPSVNLELLAISRGDDKYRMAFQPGKMAIPSNREGKPQKIDFQEIPGQNDKTKTITLEAKSDADLPVEFFVKYGPAKIEGNRLILTRIPPRARYPIEVSVVAYQIGQVREPKTQAAPSVEQTFLINKVQ